MYFCWIESELSEGEFGTLLMYCLALNQKYTHAMELLKIAWDFKHFLEKYRTPNYRVRLPMAVALPALGDFQAQRK